MAGGDPRSAIAVGAEQLRLHRMILACGAGAYLGWWGFVELSLPGAFNPLGSRLAVVACFGLVVAASYVSRRIAAGMADAVAGCCALATVHYFYLLERNGADLEWVVGSYITITAICAILQTARSLLAYSVFAAAASVVLLLRTPALSFVVFLPGTLTILLFANLGLRGRLALVARLRESHERIEGLFDAVFEGIAVVEDGTIREVNGALSRLVGLGRQQLVGRPIDEVLPAPTDGPAVDSSETSREIELIRGDGSRIVVEVVGKRHVTEGKTMRLLAIRDLTARKQAEADLVQANRELESFSYSVAHDLRTPLRSIDGFSHILIEEYAAALDDVGRGHLDNVRAAAQRMGKLIDDLLGLARVGRAEMVRERVDVSRLASRVIDGLRSAEPGRAVTCTVQPGIVVDADPRLLSIALENLLGNAWKFTSKTTDARIEVAAQITVEGTVLSVRDNGAGFDMAYASKLFDPFQRLHRRDEFPGSGVGLATVQRIVHRHGGRIWAEATVDGGATFHLTLPPAGWRPTPLPS